MTVYIIIVLALLVVLFFIPFPHRVAGEITVRPIEDFNLSMNELGYLESRYHRGGANPENQVSILQMNINNMGLLELLPLVRDGQKISKGDTLAILSSSQVTKEIIAEASEMDRLKGELALLQALPKKEEIAEAEADVRAARANFDKLQQDLNRARGLLEKKLISVTEFETTQAGYDVARAELANKESRLELLKAPPRPEEEAVLEAEIDKQKAKLDFLKHQEEAQQIISPIKGFAVVGQVGSDIMTIINNEYVELLVPVSDFDIDYIEYDQNVKLKVRTFPGKVLTGKVVHIPKGAMLKNNKAYFMIGVTVVNNDALLHGGMTGYAKIEIGNTSLCNLIFRKVTSFLRVEFWSWW